jgi:hypothetical protein
MPTLQLKLTPPQPAELAVLARRRRAKAERPRCEARASVRERLPAQVGRAGRPYFTSIWRDVTTGFLLPRVRVSTPFSSLAEVASASMSAGNS